MSDRTVLLVDDEINILHSLKRLLRKEKFKLLTASSGVEGLSIMESEPVHLVISDQRMPGMTGTEFLQKVKQQFPDSVRVILSGYAEASSILEAINKGEIFRFFTKPWIDDTLKESIHECIRQYDLLRDNRDLVRELQAKNDELATLNERLEELVDERTQTIRVCQEMLQVLPIPIIGVSEEGFVVFTNDVLACTFPSLARVSLGSFIADVFPAQLCETVQAVFEKRLHGCRLDMRMDDKAVRIRIVPLQGRGAVKGCMLMLEVQ